MKFTCERCGKKYATAEDPSPGRVYKLKCKACGHLIVVRASAAGLTPGSAAVSTSTPVDPPSISLEIGTPEPAPPPGNGARPPAFDATTEVSTAAMRSQHELEMTPPPGDPGYVDLFADVVSGAQELPQKPHDDPFLAAARASLPDGYGTGSSQVPDPFAGLREGISATSAPEPPPRGPPPVPKVPVIPKPRQEKSAVPLVLIGAGVAVLVGILAFVMLSSGGKTPASGQPSAAVATTAAPVAPAPPAAAPPETAQAAPVVPAPPVQAVPDKAVAEKAAAEKAAAEKAAAAKADDAERRARAEQKRKDREEAQARAEQARAERDARDRDAKAQARAEREAKDRAAREAKDRDKAERDARARADREAKAERERSAREEKERAAADARERDRAERQRAAAEQASAEPEGGLTQGQIEGVLRSTKAAFDGCIQSARGTDVKLDGRRVMLRLNIQTSGTVTYPTLDDVTLNSTELGSCLKSAARLMVFPKFKGDTMHVEVPLVMR